jgi:cyclophilin family peptidyl-prolyl cis-trans isomerase/HEAT repeat protein
LPHHISGIVLLLVALSPLEQRAPAITGSPQGTAIRAVEDARAPAPQDVAVVIESAGSPDPSLQIAAIRALGRLERRDVVTHLIPYLKSPRAATRTETAFAIAQAMRGEPLPAASAGTQVDAVLSTLLEAAGTEKEAAPLGEMVRSLGRLPYENPGQISRAEAMIRQVLTVSKELALVRKDRGDAVPAVSGAVAGAELLGRVQLKFWTPSEALVSILRGHVTGQVPGFPPSEAPPPSKALQALVAARGVDEQTLTFSLRSLDDHVRRIAVGVLGARSSPITGGDGAGHLRKAMTDKAFFVRYEAVRGYARMHARRDGCGALLEMMNDVNLHVALAATDAVGDVCRVDQDIVNRLLDEMRTAPTIGTWHRAAHAMVALAKLSPAHTEVPLQSESQHAVWQVRMYAARAAAILNDVATLERLAQDPNDNVREATLAPLKRIKGDAAEAHFLAALDRSDYQLLLTAANEAKGLPPSRALTLAIAEALKRVTAEKKETSRDTRLALLQRLREIGTEDARNALVALLRDFDPRIASAAANATTALAGTPSTADPQPLPRQPLPTAAEIAMVKSHVAVLVMEAGKNIELDLDADAAPMTAVRFLRLANANYFDGLTFHRVVPNFVVQGGSPGANEYAGDGPYLRDEISRRSHTPGTIGLSTRGRDTGDAQLFFNLVDNPRLDFEYTIFGEVSGSSLTRMHKIVEGDVIRDVKWVKR